MNNSIPAEFIIDFGFAPGEHGYGDGERDGRSGKPAKDVSDRADFYQQSYADGYDDGFTDFRMNQ